MTPGFDPALVAIRHAPVADRWRGTCYGALDVDVAVDHDVAADLVLRGIHHPPGRIWSSPLARCRDLAAVIAERLSRPHEVDSALTELNHGVFEGRGWDAIHAEDRAALLRWGQHWLDEGPPGGESARDLGHRVRGWHDRLDPRKTHLLIAHAGVVRALRVVRRHDTWEAAMGFPVPHLERIPFAKKQRG